MLTNLACPISRLRGGMGLQYAVVCLRGGERGTCLEPPLQVLRHKFSLFLVKNLFTHIICLKADHKQVHSFQRGHIRNCYVQVLCFQRGPQQPLKCASTLLLNFIEGTPKRNCNM